MNRLLSACIALSTFSLAPLQAQVSLPESFGRLPAGFYEEFALSEDRGKTLDALLPGTVEHYYFSSLVLQQGGQLDSVDELLQSWKKTHGEGADYRQIEARQALLRASTDPAVTYAFLERELGLRFNERRVVPGESPNAPTSLDPDQISTERLLEKALRRNSRQPLQDMDPVLLESLVRRRLTDNQRGWLLEQLPRPDVPGLVELIVQDMASSDRVTFGTRSVHAKLTLAQLEALRAARPEMLSNSTYVNTVMQRLAPRFPETIEDRADQLAYLERAWEFASLLPQAFVSLKAHLLYHWIAFELDGGGVNEERLLTYLRLPRQTRLWVSPRNDSRQRASLGDDFRSITPFPAIGSEDALIHECLLKVFQASNQYQRYVGALEQDFVRETFAEAKLLYGDPEQADEYIKWLGAARAEALRQRVDIEFARTNPRDLAPEDEVTLQVDVKNVDRMIVKVFEVDPVAYFDRFERPVNSSLDLDGLVANETRVLEFDAPPIRRVRRELRMDSLSKPGTYVVELIGGGVSSRAVVVKGALQLLERQTAAGHLLRVIDGSGQPKDDAIVRFGGRDYLPNEQGQILVPFSPRGSFKRVLLRSGAVTSIARFEHRAENYQLAAPAHAPLEGLLEGTKATILTRPALTLNGRRIPMAAVKDATLYVTATTKDGTRSQSVATGFDFTESGDIVHEITVPERVDTLTVMLRVTVRSLSLGEDVVLDGAPTSFPVNQSHTESPFHSYLTQNPDDGYAVDLLGRAGEPITDTEVQISLTNRMVGVTESVRLKTDERGRVRLGPLADIDSLRVISPSNATNAWDIRTLPAAGLPGQLHAQAGQPLRVPYSVRSKEVTRALASLLSIDAQGQPIRDHFDALSLANGYLVVAGLPAGEYSLTLERFAQTFRLTVLEGKIAFGHIVGEQHALDVVDAVPLQIVQVSRSGDALLVQLGGSTPRARVQVIATRFVEPILARGALGLGLLASPARTDFGALFTTYESGREISDEYRYILDRRLIDPFPGNMLTRPGYLLHPWALQETDDRMMDDGRDGSRFGGKRNSRAGGHAIAESSFEPPSVAGGAAFHAPDFLAEGAVFLTDLRPDEQGRVRIPIADLGDKHIVQIVAMDDSITVDELIVRAEAPMALRERRLVDALDPEKPMTQQRRIEFLGAGDSYVIRDAPNAGAKTFGSLSDVFELYRTSGQGIEEMGQFDFLVRWPELSELEKRSKYSEFACHEMHVFLRERDPEFFRSIVVPHLSSKGHATFMDDWLLDRDLSGYLEPWRFEQLNVVELILLLRETGGDAAAITRDLLGLLPPGSFSLDASFAEILASRGLSTTTASLALALDNARSEAMEKSLSSLGYAGAPVAPAPSGAASDSDDFFLGRQSTETRSRRQAEAAPALEGALSELADLEETVEEVELDQLGLRQEVEGFYYRDLARTVEYAETHYWHVRLGRMNADLVTVSPFWVDFAAAGPGPFTSGAFPLANRSVTEKLLALAFLDLPFTADEPEVSADGRSVTIQAKSLMFLALEDIALAASEEGSPTVLVGQDFFDPERRSETVDGVTRDRFVTGEFLKGVRYGCRMVVTNPSSSTLQMQLLAQIPEGAIPLGDSHMTRGIPVTLGSYGTTSLETYFYFPKSGTYRDYPVHAGSGSVLLGAAEPSTLQVVDEVSEIDRTTWEWVSQNAELPEVLEYLRAKNPRDLDLGQIAWRMGDPGAFASVTDTLGQRGLFPDVLWKYAVKHRDAARTERFLAAQEGFVQRVAAPFASPLLSLDARDRKAYEHLAYEPLVNGRTHEFGGERKILNDQFRGQYQRFLSTLVLEEEIDAEERVELVYYLLLQDRIAEALRFYGSIDASNLRTRVQYDYMTAYMAFYREDVAMARGVAEGYRDYPVDLWRSRFRNVLTQADEIEGQPGSGFGADPDDRDQSQGALAGAEPLLAVEVDGGNVIVSAESIDEVEVRYHRMDVEFLFSNSPFVRGGQGTFGVIRPSRVDRYQVQSDQTQLSIPLPDDLRTANVVVEVRGEGITRQATYFAGDLVVQGIERYGQIRVRAGAEGAALPKAYVKVYALLQNGETRFHKDGYTDLRGRFDYVSLSGVSGPSVERYALLVMHEAAGASMLELAPPSR
ncbi:hypothetical protein Poly30_07620 [Planctomycetes bacterium Poly30]|uniref:MG2 domain protein n=1 Tax=Saltatorellus ferox TaxID=2528018 RepID=A0A518EMG2_9BACT|nr:hypothetical protein Poly30_07620 [Planctomycetes bacterium Poly30]